MLHDHCRFSYVATLVRTAAAACLTSAVALAIFAAAGVKDRLVFNGVMAAVVDRE